VKRGLAEEWIRSVQPVLNDYEVVQVPSRRYLWTSLKSAYAIDLIRLVFVDNFPGVAVVRYPE